MASSNFLEDHVSVAVDDLEGRHGLDAVFLGNSSVLVDVDLDEVDALDLALRHDIGSDSLAGSAPGGVEVYEASVGLLEEGVELLGGVSVVGHRSKYLDFKLYRIFSLFLT